MKEHAPYSTIVSGDSGPCVHTLQARLDACRALNAELLAACEMGAMDPDGKPYFSGPRLLREAAESIGDLEASGDMVDALLAKANAEEAAIAKAKETT